MYIILDQGILDMRNKGQNALLQAAVDRVRQLWPEALIGITTFAPHLLKIYFPDVIPVSPDGSHAWYKKSNKYNQIYDLIPSSILRILLEIREELWYWRPGFTLGAIRAKMKSWSRSSSPSTESADNFPMNEIEITDTMEKPDYADVVSDADLFIATGSQYMCDHARDTAFQVLDRLEAAIRRGIPTVMVGQGIGPINNLDLRARAKEVLPLLDLIFVRERLEAPNLLASLGVDPTKIVVTGDDAIELAYNSHTSALGNGIGISMRCMPSTGVGTVDIPVIGKTLKEAAGKYDAELVGLPISLSIHERDDKCTQLLTEGYNKKWMSKQKFQKPLAYIKDIQRCRLVVTGTFHGAVLALAQGIPVICLVRSGLYMNKFYGLADLFNLGCEIISLEDDHFQEKLFSSIDLPGNLLRS